MHIFISSALANDKHHHVSIMFKKCGPCTGYVTVVFNKYKVDEYGNGCTGKSNPCTSSRFVFSLNQMERL